MTHLGNISSQIYTHNLGKLSHLNIVNYTHAHGFCGLLCSKISTQAINIQMKCALNFHYNWCVFCEQLIWYDTFIGVCHHHHLKIIPICARDNNMGLSPTFILLFIFCLLNHTVSMKVCNEMYTIYMHRMYMFSHVTAKQI